MIRDVVCCLTPAGASAIAVIGLRGPTVWQKLTPYFRAAKQQPVLSPQPVMSYGTLAEGDMGDEIVLVLQGDAHHQELELQLHGGPGVVAWCLQLAVKLGCVQIDWPEWHEDDLWKLLPQATTKKTASILLDQCQGAFQRCIDGLQQRLKQGRDATHLLAEVDQLVAWHSLGAHLVAPWKILLMGAPNAGKSSLLNAIVGFERAIISATPGTTRDLVAATIAWEGYPLEFIDSAGLRESSDPLEAAGMAQTRLSGERADLVLWLIDLSQPASSIPEDIHPDWIVGTKADLPGLEGHRTDHRLSAQTGEGVKQLLTAILTSFLPHEPEPGQGLPVTLTQMEELRRLRQHMAAGR